MKREDFEKLVTEALENLPQIFKDSLENVDVVIEDKPRPDQQKSLDTKHRQLVLGLYQGVPLARRSHYYGMVMPDKISIFQKNMALKEPRSFDNSLQMHSHSMHIS